MFSMTYMWWFWSMLMLLLLLPMGYGWGYRGWGAPYPSYVQQRRHVQFATRGGSAGGFDHLAWGRGGDFLWGLMLFEVLFVMALFWWR